MPPFKRTFANFSSECAMVATAGAGSAVASKDNSRLASAASGAISGVVISASLQPLDVLRTRLQADATTGKPQSLAGTMRSIFAGDGSGPALQNLWRGTSATMMRVGGGAAVHFYILQYLRSLDDESVPVRNKQLKNALFGAISRAAAVISLCPITTVKTRMEVSGAAAAAYAYRNVPHALATVCRTEGVLALWRGVGPALASNVPFSAIHYSLYSTLQQELGQRFRVDQQGGVSRTSVNFASGAIASVLATCLTQPFDVWRTRAMLQLAAGSKPAFAAGTSLLAGVGPRLAKRTLQTAVLWTCYEELAPRITKLLDSR